MGNGNYLKDYFGMLGNGWKQMEIMDGFCCPYVAHQETVLIKIFRLDVTAGNCTRQRSWFVTSQLATVHGAHSLPKHGILLMLDSAHCLAGPVQLRTTCPLQPFL